jgi:TonB family protein
MESILVTAGGNDFSAIADGAAALRAKFAEVDAFWTAKDVDDAAAFAKAGGAAASRIETAARAEDSSGAASARTEMLQTCLECHRTHVKRVGATDFAIVFQGRTRVEATEKPVPRTGVASSGAGLGFSDALGIYRAGASGVTNPRPLQQPGPNYTARAMRMKAQGIVLIGGVVEPDGSLTNIRVLRTLDPIFGLDDEAVKAASGWRFTPGTVNGEPVRIAVTIQMSFTLR